MGEGPREADGSRIHSAVSPVPARCARPVVLRGVVTGTGPTGKGGPGWVELAARERQVSKGRNPERREVSASLVISKT